MKLFKIKKKEIPTGETKTVDTYEVWMVRWRSRYGRYSSDTQDESEAFVSEKEAKEFQKALANAFRLIRHTSDTKVIIERVK